MHGPTGEIVRIEIPEHDVGIGRGRGRTATPVADRPRIGASALGADSEGLGGLVDPYLATAAGPHGLHVNLGQEIFVLVDQALVGDHSLAIVDDADIERGTAHIGGDDVGLVHHRAQVEGPRYARDRARIQRQQGRATRLTDRDGAARTLRDLQRWLVAQCLKLAVQPTQIPHRQWPNVRIKRDRRGAFIFTPFWRQLIGAGHIEIGCHLGREFLHATLMLGFEKRP